jgi:hypothetical protein
MSKKISLPVGAAIGFAVSLFASTFDGSAYAASGCLAAPNRESGPGTHWNYRINQTTKQRCWYLKKVGGKSRPRPTDVAHAARSRVTREAAATPSRAAPVEIAPAENESSIKSWFAATFSVLSGTGATSNQTREPATNEAPPARKRRANTAERTENSKSARAQQLPSTNAEAAEDREVNTSSKSDSKSEPEWQKTLYEEFLQWRVKQLMFQ